MAEEQFRIELERSGGFAGVTLRSSLDSSELPPEEAREVPDLLRSVDLEGAASKARGRAAVDRFQYRLVVERRGERREITLGEDEVPAELRPLIDRLMERARRRT